jgi:hypothetical protein
MEEIKQIKQKINALEQKIDGYESDLANATDNEDKRNIRNLIISCRNNITKLYDRLERLEQQKG